VLQVGPQTLALSLRPYRFETIAWHPGLWQSVTSFVPETAAYVNDSGNLFFYIYSRPASKVNP